MNFEKYKYKIETHAHTSPVSPCGDIPPSDVIQIYKTAGVHAIAITNHFIPEFTDMGKEKYLSYYMSDYEKACETGEKLGINVILGMEIRFSENSNDYLIYGIDKDFVRESFDYLNTSIKKFYSEMKNDKNVILQAHPFRNNMTLADPMYIDGIEVFNMHLNHNSRVPKAYKYAMKNKDFIITAGSDYHHLDHEATGLVVSKTLPKNSFQFAEILKSKDYIFSIGGCSAIPYTEL